MTDKPIDQHGEPPQGTSSQELHPSSGARFLFELADDGRYQVTVYHASGATLHTWVSWSAEGVLQFDPPIEDAWSREEVIKLARVLHRERRTRLLRWRG